MTRSYGTQRSRRITQPVRVVRPLRDPAIDDLGFTCFRLVMGHAVVITRSTNTMFAFVRAR